MSTAKERYYKEMCNTITYYNEHNNMPLLNLQIQEAILKVMEEEAPTDANNFA